MRTSALCIALALLTALLAHLLLSAQERRPITQYDLESMVQNIDLVIQGQVTNVEARFIDKKVLTGRQSGASARKLVAAEVTMKIEKIIAGEYDGNEIRVILPNQGELEGMRVSTPDFSPMKIEVGDRAILGIVPNTRGTGYNILDDTDTFFKLDGTNLIPYQEEYYLEVDNPIEVIAKKAKEREMPEVFKAADLVCTGIVTRLIDPEKPRRRILVSIDKAFKGTAEESQIEVDVSDVYQPFRFQKPGYKVILFLKKTHNSGYRPVAGVNGYYVIDGDRLSRGHTLPLRMSVNELKSRIKMWREVEP